MQETSSYQERSQAFLGKAREELEAGDLEQASEKAWGAAAVIVKAVAEARGIRHKSHKNLTRLVETLADETSDEHLRDLFDAAQSLHGNFYENDFGVRGVRRRTRRVEEFVEKMERILDAQQ